MNLYTYVEKMFNEEYANQVSRVFQEQLELLGSRFKNKVFTYFGFDPELCKRISLKSKLISSALKEAEGFERYAARHDDFSHLAEKAWDESNGEYPIAHAAYLDHFEDEVREEHANYNLDYDGDVTWEEFLDDYDVGNQIYYYKERITEELELSESDWRKVLGYAGSDAIVDEAYRSDQDYDQAGLMNKLLSELGLFDYDPDEEYASESEYNMYEEEDYRGPIKSDFGNLEDIFFRKYINSEFINEIGLHVEDVKYVFNASVYTPQTTRLKVQQLINVLVGLKEKASKLIIEPSLIDNPKVTFVSTVKDADLEAMTEAKTLGLHTALVDAEFENLDISSDFAPCVDTVYFGKNLGSAQGSIRFPKFNGEFVLLSSEKLKWYLGAMYIEERGNFAYFANGCSIYGDADLYITDFVAGSKATFTIGLYEGEDTFDFRLNALTSVKLGFTPIGKVNQYGRPIKNEVVYCVDTSSKVDIDLDSFFENCLFIKIKPIFVGLYVEEIKKLIFSNERSIFLNDSQSEPKVKGFFPSQFDPNQTTVLVVPKYKSPLYWRLRTNRRRNVKFDILYSPYAPTYFRIGSISEVPEHLEDNKKYNKKHITSSITDQRGSYFENSVIFYDLDLGFQGCVFYKCIFINSDIPVGIIAVDPIHMNYGIVLEEDTPS
jgi:hypothetical protein